MYRIGAQGIKSERYAHAISEELWRVKLFYAEKSLHIKRAVP
jgi:hypothetical protein